VCTALRNLARRFAEMSCDLGVARALQLAPRKKESPMRTLVLSQLTVALAVASFVSLSPSLARAEGPAPSGSAPQPSASTSGAPVGAAAPSPASPPQARGASLVASNDSSTYEGPYTPPTVVPYEGGRIPKDATIEERTRKGLLVGGIVVAASAYTISLAYALSTCSAQQACRAGSDWLYVPIIGPFVTSAKSPTTGGAALAAFDGALQLGGVGMVVASALFPQKVVVTPGHASWKVEPVHMGSGMGVGVTMTHF
jgi:hypothetical protein